MRITKSMLRILVLVCLCQGLLISLVSADEGYITTYDHHMIPGELELMLMSDFTSPSDKKREKDGHEDYFSHMLEIEYCPTNQLAFEFMMEAFEDIGTGEAKFTGFRYETRYRLFKEVVPLNPVFYAEYEDLHVETRYKMEVSGWVDPPYEEEEEEVDRERILESRLILSQDIGAWNVAFNWINESDFNSGETAFGYSFGLLCRIPQAIGMPDSHHHEDKSGDRKSYIKGGFIRPMALVFELFGALGDTQKFELQPSRQEHYFQPSFTFHVAKNSMLSIGCGIGLTKASDNIIRISLGWML